MIPPNNKNVLHYVAAGLPPHGDQGQLLLLACDFAFWSTQMPRWQALFMFTVTLIVSPDGSGPLLETRTSRVTVPKNKCTNPPSGSLGVIEGKVIPIFTS